MSVALPLNAIQDDWEFNVAGVYNYRRPGQFQTIFDFVRRNHDRIEGDIVESGVYRGNSLIAMGLLLRELGSDKKVYGYDSFSGFPPDYHSNDSLEAFDQLHKTGRITSKHYEAIQKNIALRSFFRSEEVNVSNISGSGDFSGTSRDLVQKKIELFGLQNIVLVEGVFEETMASGNERPEMIMAVLMDCDLYKSYQITFDFVWKNLVNGGLIYLDEYFSLKFPGARIATDEFIEQNSQDARLAMIQKDFADFERWYIEKV